MENARKTRVRKDDIHYGYDSPFPIKLRALLAGHTQDELAQYVGVQRQSIAQWKDGKTKPDIHYLSLIADFFDVSTDYLLGRSNSASADNALIERETGLFDNTIQFLKEKRIGFLNKEAWAIFNILIQGYAFEIVETIQMGLRSLEYGSAFINRKANGAQSLSESSKKKIEEGLIESYLPHEIWKFSRSMESFYRAMITAYSDQYRECLLKLRREDEERITELYEHFKTLQTKCEREERSSDGHDNKDEN